MIITNNKISIGLAEEFIQEELENLEHMTK